jgi:hypothetical protein
LSVYPITDDLKKLGGERNKVLKDNLNTSMTAGDKEFIESWRKNNVKTPTKRPVEKKTESKSNAKNCKKKATDLRKLPIVTTTQEIVHVPDESNNISNILLSILLSLPCDL